MPGVVRAAMLSLLLLAVPGQVEAACMLSSIDSNFNGTPIAAGNFIWFNSVFNVVSGLPSPLTSPVTISFDQSTIQFTANSTLFVLAVPNATITISPTVSLATTTFDTTTNTWVTVVPPGLPGNTFLTGLVFPVTSNLPGGINPVTWSGQFSSATSGLTVQWQWSAAVYTSFSTDNNALGVKPIDANTGSIYLNSDHAGTPENFKPFVIGGARGGGGSNFTGSYSATASETISCQESTTTSSTTTSSTTSTTASTTSTTTSTTSTTASTTLTSSTTSTTLRPAGPDFCSKSEVRSVLNPSATRFMNNAGLDHLVRTDLGESIQQALDVVGDANGDGYVLIGVIANGSGARGGNTTQHIEINRAYPVPFGLVGCSVTLHDPDAGDGLPTASITASASSPPSSPANPSFTGESSIFVMDLHAADSEVAGWVIEGDNRELRNVGTTRNVTGVVILGDNNTMHNGSATRNATIGVDAQGSGNLLETVQAMANGSFGIRVSGTSNTIYQGKVGDRRKGNGSDGISLTGTGHLVRENTVYANGGNGIFATGTNHQLLKNTTGGAGKGNALTGILVQGSGNLLQENRASANGDAGFDISGGTSAAPNRLGSNSSNVGPSGGTSENLGPEYRLLGVVSSPGGDNKADSVFVPKTSVPVKCPIFPTTSVTGNFTAPVLCE